MTVCTTCGNTDFYTAEGFYYCSLCQTQLQGAREEVYEEAAGGAVKKVKDKSVKPTSTEELTSWEIFNYTLRSLVDQMIDLGATNELKVTVLQLWATYLSRLEVAFCQKRAVRLGLNYKIRDLELLHGNTFEQLKRKQRNNASLLSFKRRGMKKNRTHTVTTRVTEPGEDMSASKKGVLTKFKRKIAAAEYSQSQEVTMEASQLLSQNMTLEEIGTQLDAEPERSRVYFNKCARYGKKNLKTNLKCETLSKRRELMKKLANSKSKSANNITITRIWGILQLGMVMSCQKPQIGDTIRWILEGNISYKQVFSLIPSDVKKTKGLDLWLHDKKLTHRCLRSNMSMLARFLSISKIPTPDFYGLATRYCTELQLPDELLQKVLAMITLCKPEMYLSVESMTVNSEAQTMAYIIIVLKLFLGLDGVTELSLSDIASDVNRLTILEEERRPFFAWTDWVQFIECRKAAVAEFYYPTRAAIYGENYSALNNSSVYFSYLQKKNGASTKVEKKNAVVSEKLERILNDLCLTSSSSPITIEFPPSLTPLHSSLNLLMDNESHKFDPKACKILQENFTCHQLLLPDLYEKLKWKYDVSIKETKSSLRPMTIVAFNQMSERVPRVYKDFIKISVIDEGGLSSTKNTSYKSNRRVKKCEFSSSADTDSRKRKRRDSDDGEEVFNVSKIACNLLRKRLQEMEEKAQLRTTSLGKSEVTHFVGSPHEYYWIFHSKFDDWSVSIEDFNNIACKFFPSSFFWLLKECSRTIGVCPRSLYLQIVEVEKQLSTAF